MDGCIKGEKAYYFEEIVKGIGFLILEKGGIPMRKNIISLLLWQILSWGLSGWDVLFLPSALVWEKWSSYLKKLAIIHSSFVKMEVVEVFV